MDLDSINIQLVYCIIIVEWWVKNLTLNICQYNGCGSVQSTTSMRSTTNEPTKTMQPIQRKKSKTQKFRALTDVEHVLLRSETYGGSKTNENWTVNVAGSATSMQIVPMLYKVFDEAVTNAADCAARGNNTKEIRIEVDQSNGIIFVYNDGKTVPITKHAEKDPLSGKRIYTPELVFFRMRAGQNFDDTTVRHEGGRNGIGIKLLSIFSKESTVICHDAKRGLYRQTYFNNMTKAGPVEILSTVATSPSYTSIRAVLDLERFIVDGKPLTSIPDDVYMLMQRRAFDIAACCNGVDVSFNGKSINVTSFDAYAQIQLRVAPLFISVKKTWSVAVALTTTSAEISKNVSFVNNVWTREDGTHVDHIKDEIYKILFDSPAVKKLGLKKSDIDKQLRFVVKCYIGNPTFNNQMKERMTLPVKRFDSKFVISGTVKKLLTSGLLLDRLRQVKEEKDGKLLKRQDGKKTRRMTMVNLTPAKKAGTAQSSKCTIILTEGLSASALAHAGLSIVKNDYYGVYALKGKILNGEKASQKQWMANVVIQNVIKILGLKHGSKYTSVKDLNYGHVLIMADQDIDGFHIRGLVKAIFSSHWPELLNIPGFVRVMKTPLVKFFHRKQLVKEFFDEPSAEAYAKQNPHMKRKYYKGLGTSTSAEAKEYFRNLDRYVFDVSGECTILKRAFGDNTAFRKELSALVPEVNEGKTLRDFVYGALSMYIRADNVRKIPSAEDGFKISQRKVVYTLLKKNYSTEQKVAQLSGIVANFSHYHSGEDNLSKVIINMAQTFPGSNNLPLLKDAGQFGTLHHGGKDHAAARYVYTELKEYVRKIFRPEDMSVLTYAVVDGHEVEPEWFMPIIAWILVNGICGLGTAWVSNIPQHNPLDLIAITKARLSGVKKPPPFPWTANHLGRYGRTPEGKLANVVEYQMDGTTMTVNELPVGVWTETIEEKIKNPKHKMGFDSFDQTMTDTSVTFTFYGVTNAEKLAASLSLTKIMRENYVVFMDQQLVETNVQSILDHHYEKRYELYVLRKEHQLNTLQKEINELAAKMKFIQVCVDGKIPLTTASHAELGKACETHGVRSEYLDISLRELSPEKVTRLSDTIAEKQTAHDALQKQTVEEIWMRELNELESMLRPDQKKRKR